MIISERWVRGSSQSDHGYERGPERPTATR